MSSDFVAIPQASRYGLATARVPACLLARRCPSTRRTACGASTSSSTTAASRRVGAGRRPMPARRIDLAGRMVLPAFVDMHTHLDKGHIWPRARQPGRHLHRRARRRRRRPRGALDAPRTSRRGMEFALRCAYAHGTAAIRTHLDSHRAADGDLLAGLRRGARATGPAAIELQALGLFADRRMLDDPRHMQRSRRPGRRRTAACSAASPT